MAEDRYTHDERSAGLFDRAEHVQPGPPVRGETVADVLATRTRAEDDGEGRCVHCKEPVHLQTRFGKTEHEHSRTALLLCAAPIS